MYDLFTSGLQAVGTKRPKLGNGNCTALIAVTLFTDFINYEKKKEVRACEHECLQITSGHSYVEL